MHSTRWRVAVGGVLASFVMALLLSLTGVVAPAGSPIALGASSTVAVLSGDVWVRSADGDFRPLFDGDIVGAGAIIRTGADARAVVTFFEGSTVVIEPDSELVIDEATTAPGGSTFILMTQTLGRTWHVVTHLLNPGSKYDVRTPSSTASVRGTAFEVLVGADETTVVTTTEGAVATSDTKATAEVLVTPGFQTTVRRDEAPEAPRRATEPERNVTVRLSTTDDSLVVDPLGRSNGMRNGKIVLQTPGARVVTENGQLVITMPNLPDGNIATVIDNGSADAGSSVQVVTTVEERGREAVTVEERVQRDDPKTVTGLEMKKSDGAPPTLRTIQGEEKDALPQGKVATKSSETTGAEQLVAALRALAGAQPQAASEQNAGRADSARVSEGNAREVERQREEQRAAERREAERQEAQRKDDERRAEEQRAAARNSDAVKDPDRGDSARAGAEPNVQPRTPERADDQRTTDERNAEERSDAKDADERSRSSSQDRNPEETAKDPPPARPAAVLPPAPPPSLGYKPTFNLGPAERNNERAARKNDDQREPDDNGNGGNGSGRNR